MDNFLYRDLSYILVGCFYDLYNEIGPAHKEHIYQKALEILFKEKKVQYLYQPRIAINFKKKQIGIFEPDFVIENKIIIELKSALSIHKVFEKQLYYYLRGTNYKVGYLVNFGTEKLNVIRRVYDTVRK